MLVEMHAKIPFEFHLCSELVRNAIQNFVLCNASESSCLMQWLVKIYHTANYTLNDTIEYNRPESCCYCCHAKNFQLIIFCWFSWFIQAFILCRVGLHSTRMEQCQNGGWIPCKIWFELKCWWCNWIISCILNWILCYFILNHCFSVI